MSSPRSTHNIVTLDQENGGLVAVMNGGPIEAFDPATDLHRLPAGGGYVIADANVWAVRNDRSQSQYCWATDEDRARFLSAIRSLGYQDVSVANMLARWLWGRYKLPQAEAVTALYLYAHEKMQIPATDDERPRLACGACVEHTAFPSGHAVRTKAPEDLDISRGQRAVVKDAFLRLQNGGGYDSAFMDRAVEVVWAALTPPQRTLMNMAVRTPNILKNSSPNRVAALAACTHDPATGQRRTHNGRPWGLTFIIRCVIGLNGAMRGTGPGAPGNPMRAVLRSLGKGHNPATRKELDRAIRAGLRALLAEPTLPGIAAPSAGGLQFPTDAAA